MGETQFDVIVIGGGPAGLSCALYTSRAKLSTIVLDRAPGAGALANSTKIANYPGVMGPIPGEDLLDIMRRQALDFGANYARTTVAAVDVESDPKVVYTTDATYNGRALVIATGSMGRRDKIEGEAEFTGRGVAYCATCDAAFFTDKVAAVVGDDETAIEESLFLARFARKVHLFCPKSQLAASEEALIAIERSETVTVYLQAKARRVVGEKFVTGLSVKFGTAPEEIVPIDGVFMLLSGTAPITDFLSGAVKLSPEGCIEVNNSHASSVPGLYAVGDVTCIHPNQAIIAAAEGVIAALEVDRFLSGGHRTKHDHG